MRCSTITALCTLLLPFTSAKCYNDSPKNTNKQFGLDNVNNSAKLLQGFLDAGQVRGVCVTDSKGGYSWYFSVRNTGKTGQTHSKAEIESYLRIEIQGCNANGGYSTHGKTQFNSDPNSGVCTDTKYINEHEPKPVPPTKRAVRLSRQNNIIFSEVSDPSAIRPEALAEN